MGFPPDTAMVTFPISTFLPGADLTSLETRRNEFYEALMHWSPATGRNKTAAMIGVDGASFEDALGAANDYMAAKGWGDGLPMWPPTVSRVDWILRGAGLPRNHLLGKFPPRGGTVTVESCAVALAMAGGRPEYLPVLIAAVEAFLDPDSYSDQLQATSGSPFPVVVVNGPIGKQIGLNSGFGFLGPDPRHPAGAGIGRALRLMQQNLGGAMPGTGTMAVFGHMRYTNAVFAEDESGLPPGWVRHNTGRHGFADGSNSVSLMFATGAVNIFRRGAAKETKEEDAVQGLHRVAQFLRVPHVHYLYGYDEGTPGTLILSRVVAGALQELGYSQDDVREFLWRESKMPMSDLIKAGIPAYMELASTQAGRDSAKLDPWPISSKPSNIGLVVAGGEHSSHALWLPAFCPKVVGREIRMPEGFGGLVEAAKVARENVLRG